MLRSILATIMVLHGMLHLIGFAQEWNTRFSDKATELAANSSRLAGICWLAAALLFIGAALCYLFRRDWFWIPAAAALALSQALILAYWSEAKYGTVINMVLLVIVAVSAAAMRFNRAAMRDVETLLAGAGAKEILITAESIDSLPLNVQRWLLRSGVVGRKTPNTIRVVQKGELRTKPGGTWLPFEATEYFSVDPPAFVWSSRIKAARIFPIAGRDKLQGGQGHMLIQPLYLFTASNSVGKEVNQGTLLRYLAESAWFPQTAVSKYITWQSVNENQARATITYGDDTASGIFTFDGEGRVIAFEAKRFGEFDGVFRKETWSVATLGFQDFDGITVGHKNEVTWKLPEGDFLWLRMHLTNISPLITTNL